VHAEAAGKVATAISTAHAQALAQLTNRLATIQLLRDGLYRACEAYANGALSDIAYAVMLSGYGDVMVTLLTGELVAGNFGQALAILGTSASGTATATTRQPAKDAAPAATEQTALEDAHKEDVAAGATSQASTSFYQAVGTATTNQKDIAHVLREVQRKFVERISPDTFTVACLIVLAEEGTSAHETALTALCKAKLGDLLSQQERVVEFKIKRPYPMAAVIDWCQTVLQGEQGSAASTQVTTRCQELLDTIIKAEKEIRLRQSKEQPPPGIPVGSP
jgi:hypothetical protein